MSKVLLLEYFSSRLYELFKDKPSASLLAEGFLMLHALAKDFFQAGFEIIAPVDKQLYNRKSLLTPVNSIEEALRLTDHCEYFYVIAPCHRYKLVRLVSTLSGLGLRSLNSSLKAIELTCDKYLTYLKLRQAGLRTPYTVKVSSHENLNYVKELARRELSYPIVIKPICGDGCLGLSIAYNDEQLEGAFRKAQLHDEYVLLQEYVNGKHISASLFAKDKTATILSVNQQFVSLKPFHENSKYLGGLTPLKVDVEDEVFVKAALTVEAKGYVGIDAVKASDGVYIVEINPRLTTPYIALREVSNFSLAKAFFSNKVEKPNFKARAFYYKKLTGQSGASSFNETLAVEKKPL